ncbi:solute carrier family 26 member 10 isoform X3 [Nerophis ophidion]|uniref:solute carrier family 26 member 10 isoform X3 n=1 Tax=Nerophis ophidion TaxID=159077 RepID=UPI002ADF6C28|nr:solute carrier family 26 member 10 isoform X3 [Nerophis ophidion]
MSASVAVYRSIFTEDRFKQAYGSEEDNTSASLRLRDKLAVRCRCSQRACLHLLRERVPIFDWLPRYRFKKCILGDTVAGLTVGVLHIPQGMAFALLTSVAPIFGLYTSFFPVVLYMIFGTGRHVSTGTFAVVSLMTGSVVEQLVPTPLEMNSSSSEPSDFELQKIGVASAVALLSGIIMLCMFGLQLGFLSTYLSEPIVKAFTSAAAFHVTVSQLQSMLGLRLPRHTGTFSLFKTLGSVLQNLPQTNTAELLISLVCLAVLVPVKEINTHYRQRLRMPIPVEILTVIIATGVAYAFCLDSIYEIEIVGHIPAGFPKPRLPALNTLPHIAGDTVAITFVGYAVSVSLAMIYADKHGYSINPNQELLAHGISNTVSSFFTCFPSSATLATTNILESAGGYTQMVWVVTWLSVVVLNVDLGLAIGVVFSMMTVICRTQRAGCSVLGRASNTEIYRPVENHSKCYEVPGIKILTYNGPIYYGNRSFFKEEMSKLLGLTPEKIRSREKERKALEKRERQTLVNTVERGIENTCFSSENELFKSETSESEVQTVLIDCSSVVFVDVAGARLFTQMCIECQKVGVHVYMSNCNGSLVISVPSESVLKILTSSGLMNHMKPQHIFVTVHDAVMYIQQQKEKHPENTTTVWV